ncbi:MAG: DMT family transporter [Anaerolineae bacterium]|nr:DMT family transporter [Anaerolineae bacterium]
MTEQSASARAPAAWRPYAVMLIGVIAVSFAAIFIRLAQEESAPSLVLAAARLSVATLVLTPAVLRRHLAELRAVRRGDLFWAIASGAFLGLHFATWITSLEYTTVVNSVTLVTTSPLWVALLAPLLLGERLTRATIIGLALAIGGGVLVAVSAPGGDPPTRYDPWLGNGLALIGAVASAVYLIIGRRLRAHWGLLVYIWLVYGVAALLLVGVVIISGAQVGGLPGTAYLWMILLGLVPQLIGHSSFNYALGYLPAAYVSLVILGEPIGSGLLAMVLLEEWPAPLQIAGAALILVGIGVASREQPAGQAAPQEASADVRTLADD